MLWDQPTFCPGSGKIDWSRASLMPIKNSCATQTKPFPLQLHVSAFSHVIIRKYQGKYKSEFHHLFSTNKISSTDEGLGIY